MPQTSLFWYRRDLRLSDNPALAVAVSASDAVIPVFVWDPALTVPSGPARLAFLSGCLDALTEDLSGALVVRRGRPAAELRKLVRESGALKVFATADFGPYGARRDRGVAAALAQEDVELTLVDSNYAAPPGTLLTGQGDPFQVFTPFSKAWWKQGWDLPTRRPRLDTVSDGGLAGVAAPHVPGVGAELPAPGEEAAHGAADRFLGGPVGGYRTGRDHPDQESTSRLSPYLRFGCIHPRQLLHRLEPGDADHDRFATELCWRDFYADVLWNRPDAARRAYRPEWRSFQIDEGADADRLFQAWTEGRTGYPIVDAGMRQLRGEGWMHNRVRMIVASFLVKDLHVDWGRGARWFMSHLVDADLASNQLNWQWVAGSGTDAAPYFRIFNPVTQGKRYDPAGEYVRRWVPELRRLPPEAVHEPWKATGSLFGSDYPDPIVDHSVEREEALARYAALRARPPGRG